MSRVEVELYALSNMNTVIGKLWGYAQESTAEVAREVERELERLRGVEKQHEFNVKLCQLAYDRCASLPPDEDGYYPDCSAEEAALRDALQSLELVQKHIQYFEHRATEFTRKVAQFEQIMSNTVGAARAYLDRHIDAGLWYLKNRPEELGSISGAGTHGTLYQSAKRELYHRVDRGEVTGVNPNAQTWVEQQVRAGNPYYRTPPYFHIAHRVAGVDIPENLEFRWAEDNLRRMREARRLGLPRTYY